MSQWVPVGRLQMGGGSAGKGPEVKLPRALRVLSLFGVHLCPVLPKLYVTVSIQA